MQFKPGFRLSKLDIGVIAISIFAALILYRYSGTLCFIAFFVVAHFFLFCNVTRMSRIPELIWGTIFVLLFSSSLKQGIPSWGTAIGISLATTIVLIVLETRKESYHGIFWEKINPELPQWFAKQNQSSTNS
jgi:hypothetical protein